MYTQKGTHATDLDVVELRGQGHIVQGDVLTRQVRPAGLGQQPDAGVVVGSRGGMGVGGRGAGNKGI